MKVKITKSAWLPLFGQSYIVLAFDNNDAGGQRIGELLIITFNGDRKSVGIIPRKIVVKLPLELFNESTVIKNLIELGKNEVQNQVFEFGNEQGNNMLAYLPDLAFTESNMQELMLSAVLYRSVQKFKDFNYGPLLSNEFFKLTTSNEWFYLNE